MVRNEPGRGGHDPLSPTREDRVAEHTVIAMVARTSCDRQSLVDSSSFYRNPARSTTNALAQERFIARQQLENRTLSIEARRYFVDECGPSV